MSQIVQRAPDSTAARIVAAITPVFRRVFEKEDLVLTRDLDAAKVDTWDSLNHITLVIEIELLTGVRFTTDELATMTNVGDLIDQLASKGYVG